MGRKVTFRAGMDGAEKDITVEIHDADCEPWGLDAKLEHVGTDVERLDGPAKVTGAAKFTADVRPDGMLWAGFVTSPHAHAEVVNVDDSEALAVPGLVAIHTTEKKVVRHAGQIVASVCGATPQAVNDAIARVKVTYRPLPHVVTTEDAMQDGAPKVDPSPRGRIRFQSNASRKPDQARKAAEDAEVKASGTWRTQVQTHSAFEGHGTVSRLEADGSATVWASTQSTTSVKGLGRTLGVKSGQVRVLTPHMGGGFGAKFGVQPWDVEAAKFAVSLKRPVRAMLDRRLEHLVGGNRPDSIQEMTLVGTNDGTFTGLVGRAMGTAGNGTRGAGCANTGVYRIPAVAMEQATVPTFTQRGVAFRAPGHPQGIYALEGVVELFAHEAGLDALEVRLKNDPHPIRQLQWKIGAERIGWAKNRRTPAGSDEGPVKRGVGCAAAVWYQKGGGSWNVDVRVDRDGTVTAFNGAQDIGTGTRTVLAILVAEELGLHPHAVQVRLGDTAFPPGPGSGGSTTAPSLGPSAREAGLRAREGLAALLAVAWGVDATEIRNEGGAFTTASGRKASFGEVCALIGDEGLQVRGTRRPNYAGFDGQTAGCQFAQVAVDTETGVITVEKVVAVHDCGRVIDTLTSRSQVNGGVIQGISYALYEDRRLDKNLGDMVNPTLDTYRISGMADTPEIDIVLTSVASGFNNVGMMGLGEPVTVPTAGAVANAVFNALGVQLRELPMTPDRVLTALGRI